MPSHAWFVEKRDGQSLLRERNRIRSWILVEGPRQEEISLVWYNEPNKDKGGPVSWPPDLREKTENELDHEKGGHNNGGRHTGPVGLCNLGGLANAAVGGVRTGGLIFPLLDWDHSGGSRVDVIGDSLVR